MSRTAMGIDHLRATGQPDPNNPGQQIAVPAAVVGRWAQAPLGFIHIEPASQVPIEVLETAPGVFTPVGLTGAGDQEWIYIYNPLVAGVGVDILARQACSRAAVYGRAGAAVSVPAAASSSSAGVMGVAQYDIPQGFFGFILRTGPGIVTYDTGPNVGGAALIMGTVDGEVDEAGAVPVVRSPSPAMSRPNIPAPAAPWAAPMATFLGEPSFTPDTIFFPPS